MVWLKSRKAAAAWLGAAGLCLQQRAVLEPENHTRDRPTKAYFFSASGDGRVPRQRKARRGAAPRGAVRGTRRFRNPLLRRAEERCRAVDSRNSELRKVAGLPCAAQQAVKRRCASSPTSHLSGLECYVGDCIWYASLGLAAAHPTKWGRLWDGTSLIFHRQTTRGCPDGAHHRG